MYNRFFLFILVGLYSLWSCRPQKEETEQSVPPVYPNAPIEVPNSAIADSIDFYRPKLGITATVRQFPFSSINQPATTLRLMKLLYNGKLLRTYQYDEQSRLKERTDFYADGTHIYQTWSYSYEANGAVRINTLLNKEAPFLEGYPQRNDLVPGSVITYVSTADSLSWIRQTTDISLGTGYPNSGRVISYLGFNPSGEFVWQEDADEQGYTNEFLRYQRNKMGNILIRHTQYSADQWSKEHFVYDNKPNPFRLTGDFGLLDVREFEGTSVTNPNNIVNLLFSTKESQETWHYDYTYRTDGYPSRMKMYRKGELEGTFDYIYNQ